MLVQCPKCMTTYKVSDEAIKGTSPAFRCSRCKHTFELEQGQTVAPAGERKPAENNDSSEPDERELTFTFDAASEESRTQHDSNPPLPEAKEPGETLAAEPEAVSQNETSHSLSMRSAEAGGDQAATPAEPRAADEKMVPASGPAQAVPTPVRADPPSRETAENIVPINEFRDQAASTVPYLTLFGLLVIFFFLTTAYLEAHPKISESMVRKIPLIGPSVLRNSYLKNGVLIKSQRATYQSIEGNREVLVVTGEATNQNPVVVREVRVLSQLYNSEGKAIEQQVIWLGNALSPKIIRGMSPQDIADLQRLKPLKSFEVPPGDSVPFAIVFLRPAKAIKDFSCEVVSAESDA